ncbi:TrkH family potassium uptake protein [Arthrobacter koreensis]|uniref:TrkH family potassium uptake protein n=1 Tax=Arthrobacter koreensis TaxID=199136 RepID=UPI002DB78C4A|nr:potassium transporter TrkG [Arthrobacter koreensis]MEB7504892.1 TrkH family potassium uptake protein [Arthrobacter koreensis]
MPERAGPGRRGRVSRPSQVVFLGFVAAALCGTGLLMLPVSDSVAGSASSTDALFTAVSALCVTGLSVVETHVYWSTFGQVVILALIQIGGLGVMTFASIVGLAVIGRFSFRSRLQAIAENRSQDLARTPRVISGVVRISLITEAVTALALALRFWLGYGMDPGEAVWLGVFHAVSAFNNAGFSLFPRNLEGFASDPLVCIPVAAAVIIGGLGFPVLVQLRRAWRKPVHWSINTRLVLWGTLRLLPAGAVFIALCEWNNPQSLGPLSMPERVLAAFFMSVQTRTAGFSSIDVSQMDPLSWLGMDVLMFVGAGPAGTGGGIKVTTFAVLVFAVVAESRGNQEVTALGKSLPAYTARQALVVVLVAGGVIALSTAALMAMTDYPMDRLLFETVSAFGTVGLSAGVSSALPVAGELILVVLMFTGRLGPLLLAAALALQERRLKYRLPEERPIIG